MLPSACWQSSGTILMQLLIASLTKDHHLTRRKAYGGWWLTSDEIYLSITYFISQCYNGNLAQMPTFTWWSYAVRWNEFQAQSQAALLFAVSNPEGPQKAELSAMTVWAHTCNCDILRWIRGPQHPKCTQQTHIFHNTPKPALFSSLITRPIYLLWAVLVSTPNNFCYSLKPSSQGSWPQSPGSPHSCVPRCPVSYDP